MGLFDSIGSIIQAPLDAAVSGINEMITGLSPVQQYSAGASGGMASGSGLGTLNYTDLALAGLNYLGADQANADNAEMARRQMEFQERMSSTAHQREVKDLLAAGLNPILSAKYGGSSTPGGSTANMQNTMSGASQVFLQSQLQQAQIENIQAQTRKTNVDADYTQGAQTLNTLANILNIQSQTNLNDQQRANLVNQLPLIQAQIQSYAASARASQASAHGMELDNVSKGIVSRLYAEFPLLKQLDEVGKNSLFDRVGDVLSTLMGRRPTTINKTYNWSTPSSSTTPLP